MWAKGDCECLNVSVSHCPWDPIRFKLFGAESNTVFRTFSERCERRFEIRIHSAPKQTIFILDWKRQIWAGTKQITIRYAFCSFQFVWFFFERVLRKEESSKVHFAKSLNQPWISGFIPRRSFPFFFPFLFCCFWKEQRRIKSVSCWKRPAVCWISAFGNIHSVLDNFLC